MIKFKAAVVGFVLLGFVGCSDDQTTESVTATTTKAETTTAKPQSTTTKPVQSDPRSAKVTQSEFGEAWPFSVPEGTLRCVGASSVVFDAGGRTYAVNGTAKSQTDFPDFDPIWANDPKIAGTKKDIGPMITRGLTLCPK